MKTILILIFLALTACGGSQVIAPIDSYSKVKKRSQVLKPPRVYIVRKGDTLFSISWRYGYDYKALAKINGIKPPYVIYPAQKIVFKSYRKVTKAKGAKPATSYRKPSSSRRSSSNEKLSWRWPTNGKVISTYSKNATGRKGIDIIGKPGQSIVAAAPGKVVYGGNGLPRYGKLLIIKHNDEYLSAYAHNKTLLVKEGQWVKSGQKIATLGRTGTQRDQLHFEIRKNGNPVDPMKLLQKK